MPSKTIKPCRHPACGALTTTKYCQTHKHQATAQRGTRHQRGYGKAWDKLRPHILRRDPMCQACHRAASTDVDHITPKSQGGTDDPGNLQGLCRPCHRSKTTAETKGDTSAAILPYISRRPTAPVVVLCGPPGAGKSRRISHEYNGWDVIDISHIKARISGNPIYADATEFIWRAIAERNRRLEGISKPTVVETLAPQLSYRRHWREQLNATIEVIEADTYRCTNQIQQDPRRQAQSMEYWTQLVTWWWTHYISDSRDTIVST